MHPSTFSIAAYDAQESAFGVAVASKFLASGAVVCWARAGAGAVATQALAKVGFGPDGLSLMESGRSAAEALEEMLAADPGAADRQVGLVDAQGRTAAHTGNRCIEWAGHRAGPGFTCQGNILAGSGVLESMAEAYESAGGELADRLVEALHAGEAAGGDRRGKQSAALLVARPGGGYGGDTDRYLDLRVDDDPEPVVKLGQLVESHHIFFGIPRPEDRVEIDEGLARELQALMRAQGFYRGEVSGRWDGPSREAFWAFIGQENLEERWSRESPAMIDRPALEYLRARFGV